ncbi:MAG: hypothetical protein IJE11_01585 [Bacteroidales bacterium]|nr:hypothetical protein [Bacteroidales bacterium]
MKDIVISSKHIRRELWIFLGCIVAMELVNVYAIADYGGKWSELVMSLGFVVAAAVVAYAVVAVVRLIVYGIVKLIKK